MAGEMRRGGNGGFEIQEHTADVRLAVWGEALDSLFSAAAEGFYRLLGEVRESGDTAERRIELEAPDASYLLHDWLAELLFIFDSERRRATDWTYETLSEIHLRATASTRAVDFEASRFDSEIKAVTYHGLEVTRRDDRFEATVILDL